MKMKTRDLKTKRTVKRQQPLKSSRKDKLAVELQVEKLTLSDQQDEESEDSAKDTVCPLCGLIYGTDNSVWICCDSCDTWYDFNIVNAGCIPDLYFCQSCS